MTTTPIIINNDNNDNIILCALVLGFNTLSLKLILAVSSSLKLRPQPSFLTVLRDTTTSCVPFAFNTSSFFKPSSS